MNTVSLLLQDSGTVEYYTDPRIIEAARRVMGGIDLDPANCLLANHYLLISIVNSGGLAGSVYKITTILNLRTLLK